MKNLIRYFLSPKSDYTFYKSKEFNLEHREVFGAFAILDILGMLLVPLINKIIKLPS